jgi:hypothetical protein
VVLINPFPSCRIPFDVGGVRNYHDGIFGVVVYNIFNIFNIDAGFFGEIQNPYVALGIVPLQQFYQFSYVHGDFPLGAACLERTHDARDYWAQCVRSGDTTPVVN